MRFGAFEYPDFFVFKKAAGFCLDCGAKMVGGAVINAASTEHCAAIMEGELVHRCGDHHYKMRLSEGGPQHAVFRIVVGNRTLGQTNPVSWVATQVGFQITDANLAREFAKKHRELQAAFRKYWG